MTSIIVVFDRTMELAELKSMISEMGGRWIDDPTLNHGFIKEGTAAVYCNTPHPADLEYSPEELLDLASRIGNRPRFALEIDLSHGEGSEELAFTVAHKMVQRWGGLVDDNGINDEIDFDSL